MQQFYRWESVGLAVIELVDQGCLWKLRLFPVLAIFLVFSSLVIYLVFCPKMLVRYVRYY